MICVNTLLCSPCNQLCFFFAIYKLCLTLSKGKMKKRKWSYLYDIGFSLLFKIYPYSSDMVIIFYNQWIVFQLSIKFILLILWIIGVFKSHYVRITKYQLLVFPSAKWFLILKNCVSMILGKKKEMHSICSTFLA